MKKQKSNKKLDEFLINKIKNPSAILGGNGGIDRDKLDPPQNGEN